MASFGRVITAMVTPFDPDLRVDFARAGELAKRLVANGSDALVVAGTTGESPTLSVDEKIRLAQTVVEAVGREIPVIAGTGSNSTQGSIELTRKMEDTGVAGVMLVAPYYNKPSQEGLYRHFKAVAESTDLPVILYNVPGRTSINMLPATVLRLCEIRNIVALKEASGNLDQAGEIIASAPESFTVYSGDDSLTLPLMAIGAAGVVSVASHIVGTDMQAMLGAYLKGDVEAARRTHLRLLRLFKTLFITSNPVPVKAALEMVGFPVGGVRQPLWSMESSDRETLKYCLQSLGLC